MKSKKPLENIKVLITRGKDGAKEMSSLIERNGGVPVVVPLLQFQPYIDQNENVYLSNLHTYEWIIFTSKNGVKFFLERLKRRKLNLSSFKGKFAAVGSKTKQMCEEHGLPISFIPDDYTAEDFVEQFIIKVNPSGGVLIPKGNLAGDVIAATLIDANIPCSEWLVYETILPTDSEIKLRESIEGNLVDIITFTSSSTVHHFMKVVDEADLQKKVKKIPIACIGPVTLQTLEEYGFHVKICPRVYTVNEMVKEIIKYVSHSHRIY